MLESFEDVRLDPEEILDFGDRVLVTIKVTGTEREAASSVSQPHFQVITFAEA